MAKAIRHDEWWKKRVDMLTGLAAKVSDVEPQIVYEKNGFWPVIKLVVMQYALGFYVPIMRKQREQGNWDSLHFVDLCAGSGITKAMSGDPGKTTDPLVAAGSALIGANEPAFDFYHFVEPNPKSAYALDMRLERILSRDKYKVYSAPAKEAVRPIAEAIQKTSKNPHFLAFVDPEGFEVALDDIMWLFGMGRGDLLFNFQYMGCKRAPQNATRFFGRDDWPANGTEDEIRAYFHTRLADWGRPMVAPFNVVAGKGRYAYEVVYCAAKTASNNVWLDNLHKDLGKRIEGMDGMALEDILYGGQRTLF